MGDLVQLFEKKCAVSVAGENRVRGWLHVARPVGLCDALLTLYVDRHWTFSGYREQLRLALTFPNGEGESFPVIQTSYIDLSARAGLLVTPIAVQQYNDKTDAVFFEFTILPRDVRVVN